MLHEYMPHDTPVMRPLGWIIAKSTDVAPASVPQGIVDLGLSKGEALILHDAQMVRLDGKHGKVASVSSHKDQLRALALQSGLT